VLTFFWHRFIFPVTFAQMWEKVVAANLLYSILMYWLILGGFLAFTAFRQVEHLRLEREKTEKLLLSSRLQALKMQLEPHFLFNAHHSIIGLMQKGEIAQAMATLLKLSDLLRISLKENKADFVTLRQEAEFLRLYMDIQQIRFKDRLQVQWCIDEALMEALIPPMLLQPIVENTIKHGIEPYAKKGLLQINITSREDNLQILIQDNGLEGAIDSPLTLGIGLANTQERLEHLFAHNYHFSINRNPQGTGVYVQMSIPLLLPSTDSI
jgi:LytS/YehU family sensor histidine kinase